MIEQYLQKKAIQASFSVAKKMFLEARAKLLATETDIEESLNLHLRAVKNWSDEVSFSDLKRARYTSDIFMELDLNVYPRRIRISENEEIESFPLNRIFDRGAKHFVILGQPGAGKTTSMKYLCQQLLYDDSVGSRFNFPIRIIFRDLNIPSNFSSSSLIVDELYRILGLSHSFDKEREKSLKDKEKGDIKKKLVWTMLESLRVLLILDGFDELAHNGSRAIAIQEIRDLVSHLDSSAVLVTSRTSDFFYDIENADQYEIAALTKSQITKFATKWLGDAQTGNQFAQKIYQSPFADTAIRPLTLAHLCAIYERIGDIPEKPKTVYRKIVNLLLEEWDQQRSVKRSSKYAQFEVDRKFDFLCSLAYVLTTKFQKAVFSEKELKQAYSQIYLDYDLRGDQAQHVVNELETHTGLVVESAYERFEFAHKSLQEYLSAEHIVRLPFIPDGKRIVASLPNEFAIATTISSNPSSYFNELVMNQFSNLRLPEEFLTAYVSRLLLEKPDFNQNINVAISLLN